MIPHRPSLLVACLLAALFVPSMAVAAEKAAASKTYPSFGKIERMDPRLDQIIPKDAVLEKLAEGFDWSEGPVWDRKRGYLLFSDIPPNKVMKWKEGEGVTLFLQPAGYTGTQPTDSPEPGSNGLLTDSQGRLVLCQHGDRRIARLDRLVKRTDKNGPAYESRFTTLADRYEGKRFNSPNDGAFKSNGDLYFTDPPYGLKDHDANPTKELPFNGVYRLAKDGKLTLLTKELTFPNGIAFSPDEKTLYVAQSDPKRAIWMAYDVKPDGTLGSGRVFADATAAVEAGKKGLPDGMKVDRKGNLFAAGPGGVFIFAPDGAQLGLIATGEATGNCAWGDDGSSLFINADMYLGRVKTSTKGAGW
jgi:gluconolactonase